MVLNVSIPTIFSGKLTFLKIFEKNGKPTTGDRGQAGVDSASRYIYTIRNNSIEINPLTYVSVIF